MSHQSPLLPPKWVFWAARCKKNNGTSLSAGGGATLLRSVLECAENTGKRTHRPLQKPGARRRERGSCRAQLGAMPSFWAGRRSSPRGKQPAAASLLAPAPGVKKPESWAEKRERLAAAAVAAAESVHRVSLAECTRTCLPQREQVSEGLQPQITDCLGKL